MTDEKDFNKFVTLADREREIIAREKLVQALEALVEQKKAIERIDDRNKELQARIEKLETKLDMRPWWKRLLR